MGRAAALFHFVFFSLFAVSAASGSESGLCLAGSEGRPLLIQTTSGGVLTVEPNFAPTLLPNEDGTSLLHVHRGTARASVDGGPAIAVVLDAALTFGPGGRALPPSTLLVSGTELRATFVLVAGRDGRPVLLDSLELGGAEGRDGDAVRRIAGIAPEQWPLVEHLVGLDEASWNAVRWLASLSSPGGSAPATTPSSVVLGPGAEGGEIVLPQGIFDVLIDIVNRVNGVRTVANNVQGVLGPARPDIRGLIEGIDLARLRQLMDEVSDVLAGALEIARELRAGFETFDVAAFRTDLKRILGDLGTSWVNVQKLGCFDRPDLSIREWDFPLALRLIDVAPPVVLYAMSRVLSQVAPDWRTSVRDLNASIPPQLLDGVCSPPPGIVPGTVESTSVVCGALMPSGVEPALKGVKIVAKLVSTRFEIMSEWAKDDDVVGLGAVVVGGATIVKKVQYPSKPAFKQASIMLDRLSSTAESLLDTRKDCLDDARDDQALEDEIEGMLRDCRPSHTIFLGPADSTIPPTLSQVALTSQMFINRMRAAGYEDEADLAQVEWNRHLEEPTTRGRFDRLCAAYAELLPPASGNRQGPAGSRRTPSAGRR